MSIFAFQGTANPRSAERLERDVEDALEAANAGWDTEHTPEGGHGAVTLASVASSSDEVIPFANGIRFLKGPLAFNADENNDTHGAAVRAPAIGANTNNYYPTGMETAIILEIESSAAYNLTGIQTLRRRRLLKIANRGTFTITLRHNSASSTDRYRFAFGGDEDFALRSGGVLWLYYDVGSEKWRGEGLTVADEVKTIQRGVIFLTGTDTEEDATLSPTVDLDLTDTRFLGWTSDTDGIGTGSYPYVKAVDAATVRAQRGLGTNIGGNKIFSSWELTERFQ